MSEVIPMSASLSPTKDVSLNIPVTKYDSTNAAIIEITMENIKVITARIFPSIMSSDLILTSRVSTNFEDFSSSIAPYDVSYRKYTYYHHQYGICVLYGISRVGVHDIAPHEFVHGHHLSIKAGAFRTAASHEKGHDRYGKQRYSDKYAEGREIRFILIQLIKSELVNFVQPLKGSSLIHVLHLLFLRISREETVPSSRKSPL